LLADVTSSQQGGLEWPQQRDTRAGMNRRSGPLSVQWTEVWKELGSKVERLLFDWNALALPALPVADTLVSTMIVGAALMQSDIEVRPERWQSQS